MESRTAAEEIGEARFQLLLNLSHIIPCWGFWGWAVFNPKTQWRVSELIRVCLGSAAYCYTTPWEGVDSVAQCTLSRGAGSCLLIPLSDSGVAQIVVAISTMRNCWNWGLYASLRSSPCGRTERGESLFLVVPLFFSVCVITRVQLGIWGVQEPTETDKKACGLFHSLIFPLH